MALEELSAPLLPPHPCSPVCSLCPLALHRGQCRGWAQAEELVPVLSELVLTGSGLHHRERPGPRLPGNWAQVGTLWP